mgnify:CR=1 FL=1
MAWLAVDKNGQEWIYIRKPVKFASSWRPQDGNCTQLPKYTIRDLLDKNMEFEDEPIEI